MSLVETFGDLCPVTQYLLERQTSPGQARAQRFSLEKFHDDEVNAVLLPEIVELANVGVAQLGDGTSLAPEALQSVGTLGEMRGQNLDGDGAIEAGIGGAIDFAHAAGSDRPDDFVRAEFGAGGEGHASDDYTCGTSLGSRLWALARKLRFSTSDYRLALTLGSGFNLRPWVFRSRYHFLVEYEASRVGILPEPKA